MEYTEMMMRCATEEDVAAVVAIVGEAQRRLAAQGVDQWQNGYPNAERIAEDVRAGVGRVLCDGVGGVVAYGAVIYTGEAAYDALCGGRWLTEGETYATIHRLCVAESVVGRGVGRLFMELAEREVLGNELCSIRVDTHPDNKVMQRLIGSLGYSYCGTVVYESIRWAYEKRLTR